MQDQQTFTPGTVNTKKSFSLVWIVPIVAILITAGMIYKSYANKGVRIYVSIENGEGIIDGKTPLMYKGIKIGAVEDVHIKENDVSQLELTITVDKDSAQAVCRKGNKFWKVEPKISLTEVSGLDTLIKGVYIAVMPAKTSKEALLELPYQTEFDALDTAPVDVFRPGRSLVVNTVTKGDIAVGAPILYNKQVIGKVENKNLSDDRLSINLQLRIDEQYMDLIHTQSIFYKTDALEVKAGLGGIKVNMGSFASFIAGGISVYNSQASLISPLAQDKEAFVLVDNFDDIMLSDDEIILSLEDSYNLTPDITKVYYKGVEAGLVKRVKYIAKQNKTQITLKLHKDFRAFANTKAHFWLVHPRLGFNAVEGLDTVVRGNYINFSSSNAKAKVQSNFVLHVKKPKIDGVKVKLFTKDIKSLKEDAGVFYHGISIGAIDSYTLNKDKKTFTVHLVIKPKYAKLISASSSFYHNSGASFEASLSKVSIQAGSLETMLRGGIAVETPSFNKKIKKSYVLHEDHKAMIRAQYLAANGIYLTLVASKSGSLKIGSALLYKQIKVGEVLSTRWDTKTQKLYLRAFVIEEYAKEVHANSLFYNASGLRAKIDLNGLEIDTESIETIISGGIAFFTPSLNKTQPVQKNAEFTLYDSKDEAANSYFDISILANNTKGLKVGSALTYKNVKLGQVESLELKGTKVLLKLQIDAKYKPLIKKDTFFWVEGFELGLSGVKNPSAALTGPSIVLMPGESTDDSVSFTLNLSKPLPHFQEEGLRITLKSQRRSGIKADAPVFFRQVKIGSVIEYKLNKDATGLEIQVFIEPCFAHLVRQNSYFFNTSGIGMEVSLFGAKVKTESVESILTGGIGVLTPDEVTEQATDEASFILNDTFEESALQWAPKLHSTNEMCQ